MDEDQWAKRNVSAILAMVPTPAEDDDEDDEDDEDYEDDGGRGEDES